MNSSSTVEAAESFYSEVFKQVIITIIGSFYNEHCFHYCDIKGKQKSVKSSPAAAYEEIKL